MSGRFGGCVFGKVSYALADLAWVDDLRHGLATWRES